jgi:hypothetical protein
MQARLRLAALDHNINVAREQETTKSGVKRTKVSMIDFYAPMS